MSDQKYLRIFRGRFHRNRGWRFQNQKSYITRPRPDQDTKYINRQSSSHSSLAAGGTPFFGVVLRLPSVSYLRLLVCRIHDGFPSLLIFKTMPFLVGCLLPTTANCPANFLLTGSTTRMKICCPSFGSAWSSTSPARRSIPGNVKVGAVIAWRDFVLIHVWYSSVPEILKELHSRLPKNVY